MKRASSLALTTYLFVTYIEIKRDAQNKEFVSDVTMVAVGLNDVSHIEITDHDSFVFLKQALPTFAAFWKPQQRRPNGDERAIFALTICVCTAPESSAQRPGHRLEDTLNLSGATGAQLKKTIAINNSLLSLADLFVAIANQLTHIPFRNSQLTYLL